MDAKCSEVLIRKVSDKDIDAIVALTRDEFKSASIDARIEEMIGGTPWIIVKAGTVRSELERNPGGCFVAVAEGNIVGYITTTVNAAASRGIIANLVVSSKYQRRGIGRKLLNEALAYFRRCGLVQAKIETLDSNEVGMRLYPLLGFREVARQIHYIMPL